ncbi:MULTISPECIES: MFS transporter [Brevibacillus]|uniref:Major facilitator superfamily (MFS) profile domain-containing protein n=1 Tax=Brevibacillus parabrevis TaxID=54914 RepID=A0A4Y3PD38_BREPA|nr:MULTISPECIES: MFS transporter [Brevibacillus]MBU8711897.1 MFS transporter [Brevibacillus parabrevis]MED2257764.1 MFS transporter [Brevibacillus parabrevis]RNB93552.1 MFS transporter [Brevibacillus parabrevis]UED71206.1 MFS transporter [Brevibacillus sp. HD3.3A]WDV97430.1 MFS transporter [Brevibacillus parabrevis]
MRVLLLVVLFLVAFDMHAQTPLLAPYLNILGVSAAMIGFVLGGYAISNLSGNLIAGPFLDRFPKKWFIAGGLILAGVMLIGQGLVTHAGAFFSFRLMLGFVMAFVSPACSAMLGETGKTALEQGEIMGKKGLVLTTAGIVSPAVGSFFAVQFGYGQSFVILGYIMIVAGVFSWLVLPSRVVDSGSDQVAPSKPNISGKQSLLAIMENRMLYPAFLGGFAIIYAQGTIIYEVPLLVQKQGMSPAVTGILFSLKGLGALAILSQFWLHKVAIETRSFAGLGILSLLMYMLAMGLAIPIQVMMFCLGACFGMLFPAFATTLTIHTPREMYGSVFSIYSAVLSVGAVLSPVVAGLLGNWHHSYFIAFFVTAGVCLISGLHRLLLSGVTR